MILFWSFVVVFLLLSVMCFFILRKQEGRIVEQEKILQEALWERKHRIPLLLEIAKNQVGKNRQTLIEMRADLQHSRHSLEEQILRERELTVVMNHMLDILYKEENESVILNALRREFTDIHSNIERAINDYNFQSQRWQSMMRWPWFKIFDFAFRKPKKTILAYI